MKYLITDKKINNANFPNYEVIRSTEAYYLLREFIENNSLIGFDIETNGLDCWYNHPILYALCNEEISFVFEYYYCDKENIQKIFNLIKQKNNRILGHNIKFDANFVLAKQNILLTNFYDTMIAEQRIWQKLDISHSYLNLSKRYLGVGEEEIDKNIRLDFIGANPKTFDLKEKHLDYVIKDIIPLFEIKRKQDKHIYEKDLYNLIYKVEFPLISALVTSEVKGVNFNLKKWKDIYEKNYEARFEIECKLDEEFRKLRDSTNLSEQELMACKGGKWDKVRVKSPLLQHFELDGTPKFVDLFGNTATRKAVTGKKAKIDFYPNNINYESDTQIMEIFAHLKEDLATKQGVYQTPRFNDKGKINKAYYSFQTGKDAFIKRKIDFPTSKINTFIDLLLEHRKYSTRINNFGVKYDSKINEYTNNLHTVWRQAFAVTGRFQSGGGRNEPTKPNFQNIPADEEMRSCFVAREGSSMITADYKGAELIVLCSLSQDMALLEMSKRDMHSEIATKCWKAVYNYRKNYYTDLLLSRNSSISHQELERLIAENKKLAETFYVDKSNEKKHLRTQFKPITFGVIYGLRKKHLADNLRIEEEEAQVMIDTISKTFPKAMAFVKECSRFVERNGYLVLNNRTKSRAYFPNVIKELKGEYHRDIHFAAIMGDVNEARNMSIQGTQADAIKEASVRLWNYILSNNIDAYIPMWVHDEIVVDIADKDLNKEYKLNINNNEKTFNNFAELQEFIMCDTFNKYLNNVTIGVDYSIEKHWVKD